MKKLTLPLLVLLCTGTFLTAQVDFGIKAGVNLQQVNLSDFEQSTIENVEQGKREVGYHAGIFANISLPFMFLQPEIVFTQINNTVNVQRANQEPGDVDLGFHRLDIPLIGGLKFGPLRVGLGPVASFNLGQQGDIAEEGLQNGSWGYQAGIGIDVWKLRFDGRYEGPFSRSASGITIDGQPYPMDARTNQIIISVGYAF